MKARISRSALSTPQLWLVVAGLLLSVLMAIVVPMVTSIFKPIVGYVGVLVIYWTAFCIPVSVAFGRGSRHVSFGVGDAKRWIPLLALALPVMVFAAARPWAYLDAEPKVLAAAVTCALINGPLEELAWRRTFRANSENSIAFELAGLGLFTLWHAPLYFCEGVAFDYGAPGLVGSSLLLGAAWMFMTRAGDAIGWPIVSHVLVNVVGFVPHFATNFGS